MSRELTFAGIGLVRLGLEPVGSNLRFANDIDPKKYEMYSQHSAHGDGEPYRVADMHSLDAAQGLLHLGSLYNAGSSLKRSCAGIHRDR